MCFSASASFTAGILLSGIGIVSIIRHKNYSHYFVAGIPLLFGLQQISEGIVWLTHNNYFSITVVASYFYLFFSFVVWPLLVPFAVFMYDQHHKHLFQFTKIINYKKYLLYATFIAGTLTASILWYYVMRFGITTYATCAHINYIIAPLNSLENPLEFLYGTATILPWFLTEHRLFWILGIMVTISYIVTYLFYTQYTISVWCFFAALLSMILLLTPSSTGSMHKS